MSQDERTKKMGQVIAKAWTDEAFKQRLLADATEVLRREGLPVPEGCTVKAVENTQNVFNLVIPVQPAARKLSDAELDAVNVAGGSTCWIWEDWHVIVCTWCGFT
jgi:hypothetical protein